jgi:hypothetical protein
MDFPRVAKRLLAATSFFALSSVGIAQAAPCLVSLANTNPDGVLSSATACDMAVPIGPGQSPAATQAGVNADNPGGLGLSWTFIDRDPGSDGIIEAAFAMTGTGSGTWLINKDLLSSNSFVVTMKGGSPLEQDFLWFLIDTSAGANTCSGAQLAAGWDLCGTWAMYAPHRAERRSKPCRSPRRHCCSQQGCSAFCRAAHDCGGRRPEPNDDGSLVRLLQR